MRVLRPLIILAVLGFTSPTPAAESHWAFQTVQRPPLPNVQNRSWAHTPIDYFILARLDREGVSPSPEADRRTLIRRLCLDLTGLLPRPEEVQQFVDDPAPDAYEKLVDRLLASPHFGERWGRHWLDVARYADSDGYEKDSARPYAYLYRDWVINAINRDLPFDQFTLEQLAGDLIQGGTLEQKVATGFHRQTLTNKEGGVDQEEFRCKANVDRASTTATVWLGLTLACAECHSHKYDPISQREFYQFYAFFNTGKELDLPAPQPAEQKAFERSMAKWDARRKELENGIAADRTNELPARLAAWEKSRTTQSSPWQVLRPVSAQSANASHLQILDDGTIEASGNTPLKDTYTLEVETSARSITGLRIEADFVPEMQKGPGRAQNGNFVLTEFIVSKLGSDGALKLALTNAQTDFAQKNYPVAAAIDGNPETGWAINPQLNRDHVAVFQLITPLSGNAEITRLSFVLKQEHGTKHLLGHFRLLATSAAPPLSLDYVPDEARSALAKAPPERTETESQQLLDYFEKNIDAGARKRAEELAAHISKQPKTPPTKAAVLVENEKPPRTYIHVRGDFLRPGDEVTPGTLRVLPSFQARSEKPDRLDLVRWLLASENPLTTRVTVNRFWRDLFGRGLVATVEDFGTRGERPSHPELLDWLATELPRIGWSRKAFLRLLVTSSTYRQSSHYRDDLTDRDPSNVWWARQNRFRLPSENVRDVCLHAAELLSPKIGGPSIRPPLPADIAALGYADSVKWAESSGEDKYRRGVYIFFQRTVPYPMLMTFDSPDGNVTCTRRERSNTPLQALTLLNDPVFFECARALGRHLAEASELGSDGKLKLAFEACLSRPPTREEVDRLQKLYRDQERLIAAQPAQASRILGHTREASPDDIEQAAWVTVARAVLNLDEFITRE